MAKKPALVFLNHRKSDTERSAERLAADLKSALGDDAVFFDRTSIEGGAAWPAHIRNAVSSAHVVLALLGEQWLKAQDDELGARASAPPATTVRALARVSAIDV